MDIDLIESTFNELMGELEKIKDLNELAESYQKKTQVLSEQLERFLSASAEGRNIVMEKILSVEDALKSINPNRSLGPISSCDVKVFSCSPESKECLPLIHGPHKT